MLKALGRMTESQEVYSTLLRQNPDNLEYYRGYLRTQELDIDEELDEEKRTKVLDELRKFSETFPKSAAPKRLALDVAQGQCCTKLLEMNFQADIQPSLHPLSGHI